MPVAFSINLYPRGMESWVD